MGDPRFAEYLAAANAPLDDPKLNRTIGDGTPRYELYHFPLSLCSQKVRTTLAEKGAPYIARDINIQPGNYHPDYVRLRLLGMRGSKLVSSYTGRSSCSSEGLDPAVVPTLVDLVQERVVVDSLLICAHVNETWEGGIDLMPTALADAVASESSIVDRTPHVALLYGAHPDIDFRPAHVRNVMPGIHDRKIGKLRVALESVAGDEQLERAFEAKIAKETAAREFVADPDKMRAAVQDIVDIVAALDQRLADGRRWVCGEQLTLADVHWSVSLFRLLWIGASFTWEGDHALNATPQPRVAAYAERLFERSPFRSAVIDWPNVPRSEYVSAYYPDR